MNPLRYLKGQLKRAKAASQRRHLLQQTLPPVDPGKFVSSLRDPTSYYELSFLDFHRHLPEELRIHRGYFMNEKRGFGEDAFHSMWYRLFQFHRPSNFLEIGVYRGQVLSLISLIAKLEGHPCQVTGVSPFCPAGDSVSEYLKDLDYEKDTRSNFSRFDLPEPELVKAYSTDPAAVKRMSSTRWDMIYIDGNHDYEIVLKDWEVCSENVAVGGLIILDDSGLTTSFQPPAFSTAGHPGPSRLAREIDRSQFTELLQVGHNRVFQRRA